MDKDINFKSAIIDEVIVEHRDGKGNLIRRHKLNTGFKHWLFKKLGLTHNSMCLAGIQDIAQWIGGLSAPTAYAFVGIGEGTTQDATADTVMQSVTHGLIRAVTPTTVTVTLTNDSMQWAHVFSKANDASLTGFTSAINEVGVTSAATSYHLLLHIAGATNYGAADSCNWDAGDTLSITIKCKVEQGA